MQTSIDGIACVEPASESGHPIEMDLEQDSSQNDAQLSLYDSTQVRPFILEVFADPRTKKPSLVRHPWPSPALITDFECVIGGKTWPPIKVSNPTDLN